MIRIKIIVDSYRFSEFYRAQKKNVIKSWKAIQFIIVEILFDSGIEILLWFLEVQILDGSWTRSVINLGRILNIKFWIHCKHNPAKILSESLYFLLRILIIHALSARIQNACSWTDPCRIVKKSRKDQYHKNKSKSGQDPEEILSKTWLNLDLNLSIILVKILKRIESKSWSDPKFSVQKKIWLGTWRNPESI